ncbi:MAG: TonB-dependent receptor [Flavobacteriales bacterium]|nr:TonB-dependent receptor [Flavobacteriales bacterium]
MKNILSIGMYLGVAGSLLAQAVPPQKDTTVKKDTVIAVSNAKKTLPEVKKYNLFKEVTPPDDYKSLGNVEIITREDIENSPVKTLSAVLSRAMGVSVLSRGPMGSFEQISMRSGSSNNNVIILLDGKRINNMLSGEYTLDNVPVSLEMIERIEIIEGSASKIYGEFAIDGAINIVTRTGASLAKNGVQLEAFGGNLNTYGGSILGGYKGKKIQVAANVDGKSSSDSDLDLKHSKANAYVSLNYKAASWVNIEAAGTFTYNGYNAPYLMRQTSDVEYMNTYNFRGDFGFRFPVGPRMELFALYSYANFKQQYDPFNLRNTSTDDPYAEYILDKVNYTRVTNQSIDFGGKYAARMIDLSFGFSHNSAYMLTNQLYGELLDYWTKVPGKPYNYYKYYGSRDSWRLYYDMTTKFKKWYLGAGITMGASPDYGKMTFTYGGEFGYNISKNLKAYVGIDRSFRNATFYERYIYTDYDHGSDDMENEYSTTWNLGAKYKNDYSSLHVTAYTQSLKEAIVGQLYIGDTEQYILYSNYSSSNIGFIGASAKYKIDLDKATSGKLPIPDLYASVTYNSSNNTDTSDVYVNNFLEFKGQIGASAKLYKNLYLDLDMTVQKRAGSYIQASMLGNDTLSHKVNSILDARLSWKAPNDRYQIYIQGTNLLNQKYYDTSYIRMPSIQVLAGVKFNLVIPKKKK